MAVTSKDSTRDTLTKKYQTRTNEIRGDVVRKAIRTAFGCDTEPYFSSALPRTHARLEQISQLDVEAGLSETHLRTLQDILEKMSGNEDMKNIEPWMKSLTAAQSQHALTHGAFGKSRMGKGCKREGYIQEETICQTTTSASTKSTTTEKERICISFSKLISLA